MLTRGQRVTVAAILLVAAGLPLILLAWSAARNGRAASSVDTVDVDAAVVGERVDSLAYAEVSLSLTAFDVTSRSFTGRAMVCLGAFVQHGWRWIDTTAGQAQRPAEAPRAWYGPDQVNLRIAGAPTRLQRDRALATRADSPCYTGTVQLNRGTGSFQLFPFDTYTVPTAIGVSLPAGSGLAPAVPAPGATLIADLPVVAAVGPDSAFGVSWRLRAETRWVPTGVEGRVAVGIDPATGTVPAIVCPASGPCAETDAEPPAPAAVFNVSLRRTIQDVLFVIAVALCPLVFGGVLIGIARAGAAKGTAPPAAELASVGVALIAVLPVRDVLVPSGVPGLTALDYMLGFELVLFAAATMLISRPPAPTGRQPNALRRRVLLGSRSSQLAGPWRPMRRRRLPRPSRNTSQVPKP